MKIHPTDKDNCMVCVIHILNSLHTPRKFVWRHHWWCSLALFRCEIDDKKLYPFVVTGKDSLQMLRCAYVSQEETFLKVVFCSFSSFPISFPTSFFFFFFLLLYGIGPLSMFLSPDLFILAHAQNYSIPFIFFNKTFFLNQRTYPHLSSFLASWPWSYFSQSIFWPYS